MGLEASRGWGEVALFWHFYIGVLWVIVVLLAGLGVLGFARPAMFRGLVERFTRKKPVRIAGAFTVLLAVIVFAGSMAPGLDGVTKGALLVWSVLFLIGGAVRLFDPVIPIFGVRWLLEYGNTAFRLIALLYVLFAGFVYWALRAVAQAAETGLPGG